MKKNGFTLAEVLITLSIIGVVATLTLPSLMTNTGEAQYKSGLKKTINTLSEAGQMASALDGFDFGSMTAAAAAPSSITCNQSIPQSISGILACHAQVDTNNSTATEIFFRDGSSILLPATTTTNGTGGLDITIDVNGSRKGPNLVSTCAASGLAGTATSDSSTANTCDTQSTRSIKDRFLVTLRGSHVEPRGGAAIWALQR